jgi:hypothetical protein
LGVLFKDSARYQTLIDREREWQIRYSYIAEDKKNEGIRKSFTNFDKSLAKRDRQIVNLDQKAQTLTEQNAALYRSTSWRITWLLRIIGQQLKRIRSFGLQRRIARFFGIIY